jgi:DNA-binding response OmpR family regulator
VTHPADRRAELARKLLGAIEAPRTGLSAGGEEPPALPQPAGQGTGPRVLVIDDDPTVCDLLVRALAKDNIVYRASDGQSGLDLLRRLQSVDVVVCDVMMPNMDGLSVAKAIKADPKLSSVPIVFLTARDTAMDHVAGIQAGARAYLTKPFKIRDLCEAVARACRANSR